MNYTAVRLRIKKTTTQINTKIYIVNQLNVVESMFTINYVAYIRL